MMNQPCTYLHGVRRILWSFWFSSFGIPWVVSKSTVDGGYIKQLEGEFFCKETNKDGMQLYCTCFGILGHGRRIFL